jgi:thiol-disulfide isomerase/thioredoxin
MHLSASRPPRPETSTFASTFAALFAPTFASTFAPLFASLLTLAVALAACGGTPAGPGGAPASAGGAGVRSPRGIDDSVEGILNQPAQPWTVSQWFNSPPLTLEQLRGKVVLVRWFMGPSCPFCSATAPTLRALSERYGKQGLAVIGMYHHKEETPLDPQQVAGWIKHFGYEFPVAIDQDWTTLKRWWLQGKERSYTSVSFLLDKQGVVRRIHLGGKLAPEDEEAKLMAADIERYLAQ